MDVIIAFISTAWKFVSFEKFFSLVYLFVTRLSLRDFPWLLRTKHLASFTGSGDGYLHIWRSGVQASLVVTEKELYSTLSPFTQVYKWVPAAYCRGVTLR